MRNVAENKAARIRPAFLVTALLVIFMVIAAVMLYPAVRDYYAALRESDRLEQEYGAVVARNEKIQQLIEDLQTPEGIEDRAREEFGWVREGEEAVNITGIVVTESSTGLPAPVEPGSVKAPKTWWTQILDTVFGVQDHKPSNPYPDDVIPGL